MLVSRGRSRERILLFGMEGVGKSLAALDIAAAVAPSRVFVIDNDNAWDRMLEGPTLDGEEVKVFTEWRWETREERGKIIGELVEDRSWADDEGTMVVLHVEGWEGNLAAIDFVRREVDKNDWVVVDSGSALWDDVKDWYTSTIWDKSLDDYFLQVRLEKEAAKKDAKSLGALDGWVDWPVINAQYKQKVMKFLVNPPCHLLVTAEQADAGGDDDKETRALYGKLSVKPRAQKRIGHNMQTVLNLRRDRGGDYYVTTVKDRGGREIWENELISDVGFASWYLGGIAGWSADEEDGAEAEVEVEAEVEAVPVAKGVVKKNIVKKG